MRPTLNQTADPAAVVLLDGQWQAGFAFQGVGYVATFLAYLTVQNGAVVGGQISDMTGPFTQPGPAPSFPATLDSIREMPPTQTQVGSIGCNFTSQTPSGALVLSVETPIALGPTGVPYRPLQTLSGTATINLANGAVQVPVVLKIAGTV